MTWIRLNWLEPDTIEHELRCIDLYWVELNWIYFELNSNWRESTWFASILEMRRNGLKWDEFHWIALNWVEVELTWMKFNCIWIGLESNCIELVWDRIDATWSEIAFTLLDLARLAFNGIQLTCFELNWMDLDCEDWVGRKWVELSWILLC